MVAYTWRRHKHRETTRNITSHIHNLYIHNPHRTFRIYIYIHTHTHTHIYTHTHTYIYIVVYTHGGASLIQHTNVFLCEEINPGAGITFQTLAFITLTNSYLSHWKHDVHVHNSASKYVSTPARPGAGIHLPPPRVKLHTYDQVVYVRMCVDVCRYVLCLY